MRASYSRLLHALAARDATTVCELLLPFGQDNPRSALIAVAHEFENPAKAAAYKRYVATSCVPEFTHKRANITGYYKLFRGSRLGAISINGPIATAALTTAGGRHGSALFVNAAGVWRLVIGVD